MINVKMDKVEGLTYDEAIELNKNLSNNFGKIFVFDISSPNKDNLIQIYDLTYEKYIGHNYPSDINNLLWYIAGYFDGKREKVKFYGRN